MAWSKVQQPWKKPLKWWYHKILCEIGYAIGGSSHYLYYRHLNKMLSTGWTLYGETWNIRPSIPIAVLSHEISNLSSALAEWTGASLSAAEVCQALRESIPGEADCIDGLISAAKNYFEEHGYPESIDGIDEIPEPSSQSTPL